MWDVNTLWVSHNTFGLSRSEGSSLNWVMSTEGKRVKDQKDDIRPVDRYWNPLPYLATSLSNFMSYLKTGQNLRKMYMTKEKNCYQSIESLKLKKLETTKVNSHDITPQNLITVKSPTWSTLATTRIQILPLMFDTMKKWTSYVPNWKYINYLIIYPLPSHHCLIILCPPWHDLTSTTGRGYTK